MGRLVRGFWVLVVAIVVLGAATISEAADAVLRARVFVDGETVSLGDIFDNVPADRADRIVSRSPAPGRSIVVDAEWLKRVARSGGLNWRSSSVFDQSVITRNASPIPIGQVEAEILRALDGQELPDDPQVEIVNGVQSLVTPVGSTGGIRVRDVSYDSRQRGFTANIEVTADGADMQRVQVSGRVHAMISAPVLVRAIGRGEPIAAADLAWRRVREDGLRQGVIRDADQIIGLTPRQSLREGQMIFSGSLQKPIAVKRGAQVVIVLKSGAMSLTTRGRALDQGSVGDTVRVQNTTSNMTIEAIVEGPNRVSVISVPGGFSPH
ncbi:flagellar basal body P-ring biosynthesis protein FlgA [Alphaproteobacteria bacterium]|nr:flagellar basal body P-ring biosynthesis protein FlgA [Alphaproteobacteria bacterium]